MARQHPDAGSRGPRPADRPPGLAGVGRARSPRSMIRRRSGAGFRARRGNLHDQRCLRRGARQGAGRPAAASRPGGRGGAGALYLRGACFCCGGGVRGDTRGVSSLTTRPGSRAVQAAAPGVAERTWAPARGHADVRRGVQRPPGRAGPPGPGPDGRGPGHPGHAGVQLVLALLKAGRIPYPDAPWWPVFLSELGAPRP